MVFDFRFSVGDVGRLAHVGQLSLAVVVVVPDLVSVGRRLLLFSHFLDWSAPFLFRLLLLQWVFTA